MAKAEDKNKPITEQITATKFAYDGLSEKFRNVLKQFKGKCASVVVVFDGIFESNKRRRRDPKRESTIRFVNGHSRLPPLLHEQLMTIIHKLDIEVHVATGEADPIIVKMAQTRDAYIVARDSDYFLYQDIKGYVPLNKLTFPKLQGQYYHMADVFHTMTQQGVALWATTITYDFISLDVLQEQFPMKHSKDKKIFSCWLESSESDSEKHKRLTCQYNLLRYIQQVGDIEAFSKIIKFVSADDLEEFELLIGSYVKISLPKLRLTPNKNQILPYLNQLYTDGKLDHAIINILVRRQILYLWKGDNRVHLDLLLPICHMLVKWDHQTSNDTNYPPTVIFNGKTYNPLELVESDDLPTLDRFMDLSSSKRKRFVLGCVDFALRPKERLNWHGVHRDYRICFSLWRLWLHTKTTKTNTSKATLLALIISFLKHSLLDTYDEKEGESPRSKDLPVKPYRQYSQKKLKSYFSLDKCSNLRDTIKKFTEIVLSNNEIENNIEECQQFYKELLMINQFSGQPLYISPPHFFFSQLTYPLAVRLSQSKDIWKDITNFCSKNELLVGFIKELYATIL
ncbi:unnamed protein product [Rotaria sp. Silwood2]|nr:unnamed protein product [Rotaria sp. Silwood2]CAF3342349.1 unnamed protein product [Rotaria sp. Silwood2]CAF4425343.1 unnamed protein product [Rotaria sp. Silwood2]CAF4506949.1 unnamed protein product [Rotaria sp. Silwood2]CAF4567446.1 unnamed protein product [Rotaria sp. Silwood2]